MGKRRSCKRQTRPMKKKSPWRRLLKKGVKRLEKHEQGLMSSVYLMVALLLVAHMIKFQWWEETPAEAHGLDQPAVKVVQEEAPKKPAPIEKVPEKPKIPEEESFFLFSRDIDPKKLTQFIAEKRPRDAERLAKKIRLVAKNFEIDPYIYAALIRTESAFNPHAVSITGCVGLTQFCTAGITEVSIQTGHRSKQKTESIAYYQETARKTAEQLGREDFEFAWQSPLSYRAQKRYLRGQKGEDHALIYGAILLKSLLVDAKTNQVKDLAAQYRRAAIRYNGDTKVMHRYARIVLQTAKEFRETKHYTL